jgi:hypothetical protein
MSQKHTTASPSASHWGFVDNIIISKRYLVFVKINRRSEEISEEQKNLAVLISHLSSINRSIHYCTIKNSNELKTLADLLISKKL